MLSFASTVRLDAKFFPLDKTSPKHGNVVVSNSCSLNLTVVLIVSRSPRSIRRNALEKLATLSAPAITNASSTSDLARLCKLCPTVTPTTKKTVRGSAGKIPITSRVPMVSLLPITRKEILDRRAKQSFLRACANWRSSSLSAKPRPW